MFKDFERLSLSQFSGSLHEFDGNSNIFFLVDTVKRKWKNLFDAYRKACDRERDQAKSGSPGSKIPTCKFYNELKFLKDIVTNRVTTTNLAILESDINVTTPPGSRTFTLQQQLSPACHPVVSQSSEKLQLTAHNHELKTVTPKQDKKGKRKTSATDEVNEFDKACLDLLQKKSNTDADTHFCLSLVEIRKSLPPKKKLLAKSKIMTVLIKMCDD